MKSWPSPLPETPTHYEVLALSPALLSQSDPSLILKKAYHRALLRHHPDKTAAQLKPEATRTTSHPDQYTVDQITQAFAVLSSPAGRAAYDNALRLARAEGRGVKFQTGVENADLDDLDYDEARGCWHRSCRCGNERGYLFKEEDLEEAGAEGELMVGCVDCSLWLRVYFAVLEGQDSHDQVESLTGAKQP